MKMNARIQTGYLFLMNFNRRWSPTELQRRALVRYRSHTRFNYNQLSVTCKHSHPSFLRSHLTSRHTWLWARTCCRTSPVSFQIPLNFVAEKAFQSSHNAPASFQVAHFLLKVSDFWWILHKNMCSWKFLPRLILDIQCIISTKQAWMSPLRLHLGRQFCQKNWSYSTALTSEDRQLLSCKFTTISRNLGRRIICV